MAKRTLQISLRILGEEIVLDYPGDSSVFTGVFKRGMRKAEDQSDVVPSAKACGWSLEARKGKETDSVLGPPEGTQLC